MALPHAVLLGALAPVAAASATAAAAAGMVVHADAPIASISPYMVGAVRPCESTGLPACILRLPRPAAAPRMLAHSPALAGHRGRQPRADWRDLHATGLGRVLRGARFELVPRRERRWHKRPPDVAAH